MKKQIDASNSPQPKGGIYINPDELDDEGMDRVIRLINLLIKWDQELKAE